MNKTKPISSLAHARAQRVRSLREALRYSRQKFCDKYAKYGVVPSTLQTWEKVRWNGLTEKGAEALVKAFGEEGFKVTMEWLLFGVGENPLLTASQMRSAGGMARISEEEIIGQELRFFHQLNPEAVDAVVADDGLAPWLVPGDRVAGRRFFDNDMELAIGHPCIVQMLSGNVFIRLLKSGSDIGYYTLACTNPGASVAEPTQNDIKLFSAAPILWIRKSGLSS